MPTAKEAPAAVAPRYEEKWLAAVAKCAELEAEIESYPAKIGAQIANGGDASPMHDRLIALRHEREAAGYALADLEPKARAEQQANLRAAIDRAFDKRA